MADLHDLNFSNLKSSHKLSQRLTRCAMPTYTTGHCHRPIAYCRKVGSRVTRNSFALFARGTTVLFALLVLITSTVQSHAQIPDAHAFDSDHDGISDEVEEALLAKFLPTFMVSSHDCSTQPAQFSPQAKSPTVVADDGTIYGQVFPRKQHPGEVELHYYHLWRKDCGEMGHRLDAEHASALVSLGTTASDSAALYWYAAAHEDTICDASQLTRAETIHAQERGPTLWI